MANVVQFIGAVVALSILTLLAIGLVVLFGRTWRGDEPDRED